MRPQIAIVLPDLFAIGAQRYVLGLTNLLKQRGYVCTFLLQNPAGKFLEDVPAQERITFQYQWLGKFRVIRTIESIIRLCLLLRHGNYGIILCVSPFLNRVVCLLKCLHLIPGDVLIEEHGYPPLYLTTDDGLKNIEVFFYRHTFWLYRWATKIRVISKGIRDFYWNDLRIRNNVILFPNLIDLERLNRLRHEPAAAILSTASPAIIYFGRLSLQKNVSFLIDCFARLLRTTDASLWIIGEGDQREILQVRVKQLKLESHIRFLGYVDNPYPILAQGNAMALTSHWEGSPQVLVEAMALDLPIVSVDCRTGPAEMIGENSERGWLSPSGDYDAFTENLKNAIERRDETRRKAALAKAFAEREYDVVRRIDEYITVFFKRTSESSTKMITTSY